MSMSCKWSYFRIEILKLKALLSLTSKALICAIAILGGNCITIDKLSDVLRFDLDAMFISNRLDLLVKLFKIFVYCAHPSCWSLLVCSCLMLIAEVSSLLLIAGVVAPFVIGWSFGWSLDGHCTVCFFFALPRSPVGGPVLYLIYIKIAAKRLQPSTFLYQPLQVFLSFNESPT